MKILNKQIIAGIIIGLMVNHIPAFAQQVISSDAINLSEVNYIIDKQIADVNKDNIVPIIEPQQQNDYKEVTVQLGDEFQIKLKENSSTGYMWSLDNLDKDYFELINDTTELKQDNARLLGAPYTRVLTLRAKQLGSSDIKINYFRPWQSKDTAIDTFLVKINIKNK